MVTALQCQGFQLTGIEWVDDKRASFSLSNSDELLITIESYWQNELRVEPKMFFSYLKATKTRLYS